MEGNLGLNNRLNNAEIILKGKLHGPEAFASYKGELYTGLNGGYVVKIKENEEVIPIAKFGEKCGKNNIFKYASHLQKDNNSLIG